MMKAKLKAIYIIENTFEKNIYIKSWRLLRLRLWSEGRLTAWTLPPHLIRREHLSSLSPLLPPFPPSLYSPPLLSSHSTLPLLSPSCSSSLLTHLPLCFSSPHSVPFSFVYSSLRSPFFCLLFLFFFCLLTFFFLVIPLYSFVLLFILYSLPSFVCSSFHLFLPSLFF